MTPENLASASGRVRRAGFWLYALHLWSLFGLAVSNAWLGLAVLSSPWTVRRRDLARPELRPILTALGFYVLFLGASIATSYQPRVSLRAAGELLTLASLVLGLLLVRGERQARRVVDGVVILATAMALTGLYQYLIGYGDLEHRIRGPFSHYMTFSGCLLVADLLLLARLACGAGRRTAWHWVAVAVINFALLGSLTRSAWLGLLVAGAVLLLIRAPKLLLLLPPAAALLLLAAPDPLRQRIDSITDLTAESNYDRICMAWSGAAMVSERPFFGIGPDMVKRRYPIYRHPTAPRYTVPHLHNSYVQLAAERGLLGLGAFLALLGISAATALRRFRAEGSCGGPQGDLHLGALLALLAFAVAGLFENNWGDTEIQRLVLFVLALPYVTSPALDPSGHSSSAPQS